jgi:hypothetical protein
LLALLPARAALLVSDDFSTTTQPPATHATGRATARASVAPLGSIDTYLGPRTPALRVEARFPAGSREAEVAFATRAYPVSNDVRDLSLLSLGFDLSVDQLQPVRVRVVSLDAAGARTGSISTTVHPPVAGALFRHTLDLSDFRPDQGSFDPAAPALRFEFGVASADLPRGAASQGLTLDNLSLARPAYYVSPSGDDENDGRGPETAFATPARAASRAAAGDVIMLLDGTYERDDRRPVAELRASGRPAAWIVFRARPGHRPVLTGNGWDVIRLGTPVAYIEIRDLTIQGLTRRLALEDALADGALAERDGRRHPGDPLFNTNGISVDARSGEEKGGKSHHIRFVGNTVRDMPGGGLSAIACDHVTILRNRVHDNAHLMRYAGSGISVFRAWDFDTDTGYKNFVLQNISTGNRCFVPWTRIGRVSDGNGIIIDDFINYQTGASNIPYRGRTLVQNNLAFGNGGSGIHAFAANHVDIVHNTAYHNSLSPELAWRQIFAGGRSRDVRVINNVLHAPVGEPVNFTLGSRSSEILYAHNLVHGDGDNDGGDGGGLGAERADRRAETRGNLTGLARFVLPSLDPALADFRPGPGSPAIGAADPAAPGVALVDLLDRPRPRDRAPTIGALEP